MAFPAGYNYQIPITIDHTYVDADLTDFTLVFDQDFSPVLTSIDGPLDADGEAPMQTDGGDIRFSSDANGLNQLAVDVRNISMANDPTTSKIELAVKIPSVSSSTDTTIYLCYGSSATESQPAPGDAYGQYAAYDDHFLFVGDFSGPTAATSLEDRKTGISYNLSRTTTAPAVGKGPVDQARHITEYATAAFFVDLVVWKGSTRIVHTVVQPAL